MTPQNPALLDIGFGDAITPAPDNVPFPVMLPDFPAPKLRAYPRYTVVAEKLEALVSPGMANTRLKDFFDLSILATYAAFDGETLRLAVQATFARRGTALPATAPLGLTATFADDAGKKVQWAAFTKKNKLQASDLGAVVNLLREFLMPVLDAAREDTTYSQHWTANGSWAPS